MVPYDGSSRWPQKVSFLFLFSSLTFYLFIFNFLIVLFKVYNMMSWERYTYPYTHTYLYTHSKMTVTIRQINISFHIVIFFVCVESTWNLLSMHFQGSISLTVVSMSCSSSLDLFILYNLTLYTLTNVFAFPLPPSPLLLTTLLLSASMYLTFLDSAYQIIQCLPFSVLLSSLNICPPGSSHVVASGSVSFFKAK